jgi:hypothetical protein
LHPTRAVTAPAWCFNPLDRKWYPAAALPQRALPASYLPSPVEPGTICRPALVAAELVEASALAIFGAQPICKDDEAREQWLDEQCHNLKHKHHAAQRILRDLRQADTSKMAPEQSKDLQECITYFGNHLHQMRYALYRDKGMPIGSGVTEAACKTLVKQRLCCSGMRWTPEGAQIILSLRALVLTESRWHQFWQKINQYGVPALQKH